jgi:hypothetical protein
VSVQQTKSFDIGVHAIRSDRRIFWFLVVGFGLLQVCAHRNDMSPDGISYIELARASLASGPHALTNAYWSPLYPFLLGLILRLLHPSIIWEFTAVHVLNFFIYLASFACFTVFLTELQLAGNLPARLEHDVAPCNSRWNDALSVFLFLWAAQFWLSPSFVNPDMCVAALVYLATALLLRMLRSSVAWPTWIFFGIVLGLAYLAKAAMFPLAFVFLACALFLAWRKQNATRAIRGAALALLVFLAIAAPWITAISHTKGRWTFGDSGKIAYAEYVNGATLTTHWQGQPPGTGSPKHPTRQILANPPIYEFAQPIPGSYPPWYDASYWYDGIRPHFALRGQLWVLFRALNAYFKMFSKTGVLYIVGVTLLLALRRGARWQSIQTAMWVVFFPSIAALGLYALVLVEFRYVSPFALMLLVWLIARIEILWPTNSKFLRCLTLAAIVAPAVAIAWPLTRDTRAIIRNAPDEQWQVANTLPAMGVPSGASLATIGSGLDAYWAHLAGDRIIAEIPTKDQEQFVAADLEKKQSILQRFINVGAQAVLTKNSAVANSMPGWHRIGNSQYYLWRP